MFRPNFTTCATFSLRQEPQMCMDHLKNRLTRQPKNLSRQRSGNLKLRKKSKRDVKRLLLKLVSSQTCAMSSSTMALNLTKRSLNLADSSLKREYLSIQASVPKLQSNGSGTISRSTPSTLSKTLRNKEVTVTSSNWLTPWATTLRPKP